MDRPVIAKEHLPWVLKEYRYFVLLLSDNQRYLGRALAWLTRPGEMQRFSKITEEELKELQKITVAYEEATEKLWQPDHMNYLWLGNNFHEHKGHGHLHLVPRYQNSREFSGMTFTDENWGRNCFPHTDLFPPKETLVGIRDALREELQP